MATEAMSHIALATLLLAAVWTDTRSRRIPNALVLTGLVMGLAALPAHRYAVTGSISADPTLGACAGLFSFLPLYLVKGCAAGDVKLMAAAGSLLGASGAFHAALYSVLAGGVLAAIFMMRPGVARQTIANLAVMLTGVNPAKAGAHDNSERRSMASRLRLDPLVVGAGPGLRRGDGERSVSAPTTEAASEHHSDGSGNRFPAARLPYAVAIAIGTLYAVWRGGLPS